jgi:hypothetical protein
MDDLAQVESESCAKGAAGEQGRTGLPSHTSGMKHL